MKNFIKISLVASLLLGTSAFATCEQSVELTDVNTTKEGCGTPINPVNLNGKVKAENANYYDIDLIAQSRVIKKLSPKMYFEFEKFKDMIETATTDTASSDEVMAIIKKYTTLSDEIYAAAIENKNFAMKLMGNASDPFVRKSSLTGKEAELLKKIQDGQKALEALGITHKNDMITQQMNHNAAMRSAKKESDRKFNLIADELANQSVTLTGLTTQSHSVAAYNIEKFVGWKTMTLENGVTYDCLANVDGRAMLKTDDDHQVYLAGVCLSAAGQFKGKTQLRVSEIDTSDGSPAMTLIHSNKTVSIDNVRAKLAYYNVTGQDYLGFKNGDAYKSGQKFVSGQTIITSDKHIYDNVAPKVKAKVKTKKQPIEVIVTNSEKNPVNTKEKGWLW